MKTSSSIFWLLAIPLNCLLAQSAQGQQMLNPKDSVIDYNPASPPVQPAYGKIGKWVRTPSLNWNTTAYKCYIYDSCDFRLHFPQTYQPGDGKKYPILVFYHGDGEEGPITDNETPLKNGGQMFDNAEVNGTFDGYILVMQNQHEFGLTQYIAIRNLIDTLVQEYGGDPYRVTANGLSGGGQAIYNQLVLTPTYFAGAIIMSAALTEYATPADVNLLKFTPIWDLDGGLDVDPTPAQAQFVDSSYLAAGSDYTYKNYSTLAHDTWDSTWLEPNFWPFINSAYLSNPWRLYGKTVFCPGQSFKVTIGVVAGLAGYQWRLNGTVIPNAVTDSLVVTQPGTYDARVLRGSTWSDWSPIPVQIFASTPAPIVNIVQPTCTVSAGTINITSPKSAGLTYSINGINYQADTAFPNLAAGTYTLTVKNGASCMSPPTTAVVHPQPVTPAQPAVTITQPSCTQPQAIIVLTSNDTGLVYSINNGASYASNSRFTGVAPGTYWPKVKNGAGCVSAFMVSTINPGPPIPAAPPVTVIQPTCTIATGTISISSPIDTLSYSINNVSYQTGGNFSGVASGSYPVTAKNSAGCVSPPSTAAILAAPSTPAVPAVTVTQPGCTVATGSIVISSPVDSFSYSINNVSYQPGGNFSDVASGSYPVTAKNGAGCVSSPSIVSIFTQPSTPSIPVLTLTQPTCTVGTGAISVSSPIDTLSYSINDVSYQLGGNFSGVAPGSYPVTAKNSAGCVSPPSIAAILAAPSTPAVPAVTVTQPGCTVATGSITISSPVDSFSYSINNVSYQPGGNFSGVASGSYPVTAKNGAGCISSPSIVNIFTQPSTPSIPALTLTQPTCTVGTGTISVSSPIDTLSYSINDVSYQAGGNFSDVAPGSYPVTAKNSAGCVSPPSTAAILAAPSTPAVPAVTVTQPGCTVATGSIAISSPVDSFSYSINNVSYQPGGNFSGVASGSYPVTAKNGAGCISSPSIVNIFTQPSTPSIPALTLTQPTCTVGTGTISVSSPIDTLSYSINNVSYQPGGNFNGVTPGSYPVTAKNGAGCISPPSTAAILAPPTAPAAPEVTVIQPTCTVATGTIAITLPVDSFNYSINNISYQPGGNFSDVVAGSYPVTAKNSEGCVSSPSMAVILTPPAAPPAPGISVVQPSCSVTTGSIEISGPLGPGLSYSVNDTAYQPGTNFTSLPTGSYPVTAKDSAGCVSSTTSAVILAVPAGCNLIIGVYPNPYVSEVNFKIVSPESGKGILVFYNLSGELMNTVIETDLVAGIPTTIKCPMAFAHGQAVVYQLTIGQKKIQGTLLPIRY